ncbi:hypothetical protein [Rhizobium sp. BK602]|uniref:hypothetical protein n=1 Tax=Rhizobium sp. BK602 TaxID=2586986 RepID=UPI001849E2A0|nr:hypothetical protein [Rhizobium sp. BK602]MBB3610879.1 hypothetical protein [Rhizobium sp. BK602]
MVSQVSTIAFKNTSKSFRHSVKLLVAFALAVIVSACQTADPRLVTALRSSSVTQIQLETAPDVNMGGFFDRKNPDPQLSKVVQTLEASLNRELKGLPGGKTPGKLIVTLHTVDLASNAGRIILDNDSRMSGSVRLQNAKTGRLIAETDVYVTEKGVHGEGNIGVFVAMAINAAQVSQKKDALAHDLSDKFVASVKTWLVQK